MDWDKSITVNKHTAKLNDDGTLTLIVAAKDPGYGNWIDTTGHLTGTALLRWVGTDDHPVPTTKVVKLTSHEAARSVHASARAPS
jgi:hypothetical protein